MYGLPCIVHDHPVMRYVLGTHGCFADQSQPGTLAAEISRFFMNRDSIESDRIVHSALNCRNHVRDRFSWTALAPHYIDMFQKCSTIHQD